MKMESAVFVIYERPRRKRTGATRLLETNTSNSLGD